MMLSLSLHDTLRTLACVLALAMSITAVADDALAIDNEIAIEQIMDTAAEPSPDAENALSFHEAYVPGTLMQFTPDYTVIVRKKIARLDTPPTSISSETNSEPSSEAISLLEFLDAEGTPLYEQRFPLRLHDTGFINPCVLDLSQRTLGGRPFLLLEYGCDPTAPGFHNYRFFALDSQRQLRQVASPLDGINGEIITSVTNPSHSKHLNVRLWTGYYDLVLPFVFDVTQHALTIDYDKQRYLAVEQYQPAHLRAQPEGNSIALHNKPAGAITETVQASAESRVTYLRAYANADLVTDGELPWVGDIGTVKWLEIDIDGKRGWINLESAAQLGLPGSG